MIETDVIFSPLAIGGFVAGVVIAVVAGRVRGDPAEAIAVSALGSGLVLAALAWASTYGQGPLFATLAAGLGATLWQMAMDRGRRPTIR
jgi:peptidoglycan/LPS O-acetylase OafA/YrhL